MTTNDDDDDDDDDDCCSFQVALSVGLNRTIEYFRKELDKSKKSKLVDL